MSTYRNIHHNWGLYYFTFIIYIHYILCITDHVRKRKSSRVLAAYSFWGVMTAERWSWSWFDVILIIPFQCCIWAGFPFSHTLNSLCFIENSYMQLFFVMKVHLKFKIKDVAHLCWSGILTIWRNELYCWEENYPTQYIWLLSNLWACLMQNETQNNTFF